MTSTLRRMAVAMALTAASVTWSQAGELTLVTEESPPNNMLVDGKIVGISTDKMVPVFTIKKTELYLACNPGVATDDIDHMNIALQTMANDGSASAIDKHYDSWPN